MPYRVALLPGDGMSPEVTEAAIADRVTAAARRVLAKGRAVTPDLGGGGGTREMTDAIIAAL